MNVLIQTMTTKKNSIIPYGVLITEFLLWKKAPKKSNEVIQKIQNPINARTLAQSTTHIPHAPQGNEVPEDEAAPATQVQGEQQGPVDRIDQLVAQMQGLTVHIDARFDAMDGRLNGFDERLNGFDGCFNLIDEALVAILSRLGNQ